MPMPTNQIRQSLKTDEPDYGRLAKLGPQILPQLLELVADPNVYVAANAASLAGLIDHDQVVEVLRRAARSASALVRTAAAGALRHQRRPSVSGLVVALLSDKDKGVRKFALKAAANRPNSAILALVRKISQQDPLAGNRTLASRVLSANSGRRPV